MDYRRKVDPELADLLPMLPEPDLENFVGWRAAMGELAPSRGDPEQRSLKGVDVSDERIPGPPGAPEVRVRTYQPQDVRTRPVLVYLHGGAFVLGHIELFDVACADFATEADVVVVSVDYRLSPEDRFPAALEDCYAALEWVAGDGGDLAIDPATIAVGGLSAGGGLAAAVSLLARDRNGPEIALQLLVNAVLDDRLDTSSARTFTDSPLWNSHHAATMWDLYLGPERWHVSPYAAPARSTDLSGLPPAYVLTSELDPLRDEGISYALRLLQAGVPVELHNYVGTFHGFDAFPVAIARTAAAEQHAALRRALHRS